MKLGDVCKEHKFRGCSKEENGKDIEGVCVYIHPKRRFYTLRYDFIGGSYYESYHILHRRGES